MKDIWTGSFSDMALAAAAARTLIDSKADVIMGSGQMSVGGMALARQHKARWFGLDSDQTAIASDIVVASQVYNWAEALRPIVKLIQGGQVRGGRVMELDLVNGGLEVVVNPKATGVPAGLVKETVQAIVDGKIKVQVE